MMDHDQIRRMLDDHEKRLRRLEEAEAGRVVAGASGKGTVAAPEWAMATMELCSICNRTPPDVGGCTFVACPYRGG